MVLQLDLTSKYQKSKRAMSKLCSRLLTGSTEPYLLDGADDAASFILGSSSKNGFFSSRVMRRLITSRFQMAPQVADVIGVYSDCSVLINITRVPTSNEITSFTIEYRMLYRAIRAFEN